MKNNKDNIRCFKFFGKFAWQNDKKYYAFLILSIIVNSLSPFVTILGTQYLIDEIADESKKNMFWIVFWVAFICIGSFICSNLKKWTGENISRICEKFDRVFKTNLCMSCIKMKFKNTEDTDVLDVIKNAERALNETGQINGLITALGNIISNFFVALGVVVLVCTRIPWLMIPVIISFAVNSYTTSKVNKGRRKFFKEMSNVERGSTYFNTELQESRYAKDIRLYDASEIFEKKYDGYVDRIYDTSKKYFMGFLKYRNVNNLFYSVSDMTIYILLVVNIFNKAISIGEFSSLFQATGEFASTIRNIVNSYLEMNYTSSVLKFYIDFVESVSVEDNEFDSSAAENGLSDNITLEETEDILANFDKCEIEFKDVSFKYPNTEKYILKNVSATIKAGEHVAIVGQNGAGKTTTLQTLTGILSPKSGSIVFEGKDLTRTPAHKIVEMGMAHVPEGRRVFADMSVYENLLLGAYTRKDKAEIAESLAGVYKRFPRLEERKGQRAGTLSGGEQQMLAMGRALMSKPRIILMDEPSMGLSPIFVNEIFDIIREVSESGTTVLLVEQNAKKALSIADRAYVLETGSITMDGKAQDLLNDEAVQKAYLGE